MGWQENNLSRGAPVLGLESKVWLATPKLMPCPAILANWKVAAAASAALSI